MNEQPSGEGLTIRGLVEEAGLGVRLVGGARGADFRLEAVYIGDLEDPTRWMVPGSLLLTTGPTVESDPEAGPRLVRLLKESGAVGVGVAILPHVHEIPPRMIDEADAVGLPLLRVPPETPFQAVTSYIFNALSSRDMHRLRRSLALQNQLLQVLMEERGVEGLVTRLADFIVGDALLFDSHGDLLAHSGTEAVARDPTLLSRVWAAYYEVTIKGTPRSVLEVGEWRVHSREAVVEGAVERILVALQPRTAIASDYDEAALTFAQRLIEVELSTMRNVAGMRRRTRAGLLDMLVHGRGAIGEMSERLLAHGFSPTGCWRVVAMGLADDERRLPHPRADDSLADGLIDAVESVLEEDGHPFLSLADSGQVILLLAGDQQAELADERERLTELTARVAMRLHGKCIRVGVSELLDDSRGVPGALAHARQCLEVVLESPRECGPVILYEDLGLRALIFDRLPDEALQQLRQRIVGRLDALDRAEGSDFARTLERFLAHDCSVAAAAHGLYLHRNSMRKRLSRIEHELQLDLSSTDGLVDAYLGVHAAKVLQARKSR